MQLSLRAHIACIHKLQQPCPPAHPSVAAASCCSSSGGGWGLQRAVCTASMAARSCWLGRLKYTSRSKRPGRRSAGSMASGLRQQWPRSKFTPCKVVYALATTTRLSWHDAAEHAPGGCTEGLADTGSGSVNSRSTKAKSCRASARSWRMVRQNYQRHSQPHRTQSCGLSTLSSTCPAAMNWNSTLPNQDLARTLSLIPTRTIPATQQRSCLTNLGVPAKVAAAAPVCCPNDQHLPPVLEAVHERQQHTNHTGKDLVTAAGPAMRRTNASHKPALEVTVTHRALLTLSQQQPEAVPSLADFSAGFLYR
jgi:hypothetical protein